MAGVTATLSVSLAARLTGAAIGSDVPLLNADVEKVLELEPGTDAVNKADLFYRAVRPLAGGANEDLDLAGVLSNAFGAVINAAEIIVVLVEAGNTALRFGPAAANGFVGPFNAAADRLNIAAGEYQVLSSRNGWAVVAGTGDKLNVLNTGGGATNYTITIIGRTVAA